MNHKLRAQAAKASRLASVLRAHDFTPDQAEELVPYTRRIAERLAGLRCRVCHLEECEHPRASDDTWSIVCGLLSAERQEVAS